MTTRKKELTQKECVTSCGLDGINGLLKKVSEKSGQLTTSVSSTYYSNEVKTHKKLYCTSVLCIAYIMPKKDKFTYSYSCNNELSRPQ